MGVFRPCLRVGPAIPFPFMSGVVIVDEEARTSDRICGGTEDCGLELEAWAGSALIFEVEVILVFVVGLARGGGGIIVDEDAIFGIDSSNSGRRCS